MSLSVLSRSFPNSVLPVTDRFKEAYDARAVLEDQWHFNVSLYTKEATVSEPLITKDFESDELIIAKFFMREEIMLLRDIEVYFSTEDAMKFRHPELYGGVPNGSGETCLRFPNFDPDCPQSIRQHQSYLDAEHSRKRAEDLKRTIQKIGGIQAAKKDMGKNPDLPDISRFDDRPENLARRIHDQVSDDTRQKLTRQLSIRKPAIFKVA